MPAAVHAFVALGSNLGARERTLQKATQILSEAGGIEVLAASPVYETAAHTRAPHTPQPDYLNAVLHLCTTLAPAALMKTLLHIEKGLGRQRGDPWTPRTVDLDLLLYDARTLRTALVMLPHPRLHLRAFVLKPLSDLVPDWPVAAPHHATVAELLACCLDVDRLVRSPHQLFSL